MRNHILPCKGRGTSRRLVEGWLHTPRLQRHPTTTRFASGPPPLAGEDFLL